MPEHTGHRIDDLISQVADPEVRATLTLLSRIEHSLSENTRATGAIASRLESHIDDFTTHKSSIRENIAAMRGAWWAGIWLVSAIFTIVTTLGGFVLMQYIKANDLQDQRLEVITNRLYMLEKELEKHMARTGNGKVTE